MGMQGIGVKMRGIWVEMWGILVGGNAGNIIEIEKNKKKVCKIQSSFLPKLKKSKIRIVITC